MEQLEINIPYWQGQYILARSRAEKAESERDEWKGKFLKLQTSIEVDRDKWKDIAQELADELFQAKMCHEICGCSVCQLIEKARKE